MWLNSVCRDVLGCDQPKRPNMASMRRSGARRILVDRRGGSIVGVVSCVGGIDDVEGDGVAPSGAVIDSSSGAKGMAPSGAKVIEGVGPVARVADSAANSSLEIAEVGLLGFSKRTPSEEDGGGAATSKGR